MGTRVIVTVADAGFVDQAKQLFSSVYHAGGWRGDYMLLAFGVPADARRWFEDRGVLVRECDPLFTEEEWSSRVPHGALEGTSKYSVATTGKFYLLLPEFKRWKTVVYLDCDIIVRASLNRLGRVTRFSAVADYGKTVGDQFIDPEFAPQLEGELRDLSSRYSLAAPTFNAGVFAFPTRVIDNNSFNEIVTLSRRYVRLARYGDQLAWNLFFYGRWDRLSSAYNYFVYYLTDMGETAQADRFYAAVLHFPGLDQRPWAATNVFHQEWKENLRRSEEMDVRVPVRRTLANVVYSGLNLQWARARGYFTQRKL